MKDYKQLEGIVGICPECKSDNVDYGDSELDGNNMRYDFTCLDCGFIGHEWYFLKFEGYGYWPDEQPKRAKGGGR